MIRAIPAFQDNYIWIMSSEKTSAAVVVDPGDADPVIEALARNALHLAAILITHHHHDHTGGLTKLVDLAEKSSGSLIPVYGPAGESIPGVTHLVREGDRITLPQIEMDFHVIDVPGHTRGHIAYLGQSTKHPEVMPAALFCGDTLFAAGCGRLFEGTAAQMFASLKKLSALPDTTQIYCAHEYTLSNLRFAASVFPHHAEIQSRFAQVQDQRSNGQITLPSYLALERRTNPFLLCQTAEEFQSMRQRKDEFRG